MPKNFNKSNIREPGTVHQVAQIIHYLTGVVNVLLLLRLVFKGFGANPSSGIVQLIYSLTNGLLAPFKGIFEVAVVGEFVIEPSILVAILIYTVLSGAAIELLYIAANKSE